jgi:hypothetical protein
MVLMDIRKRSSGARSGIDTALREARVDRLGRPDLSLAGASRNITQCPRLARACRPGDGPVGIGRAANDCEKPPQSLKKAIE